MSGSHISDDWWLLLKDYTFPNNFSDEYLTSITTRLGQMKAGQLNEKVNIGRGDQSHYSQRKTERYKPNQKINRKGFSKHTPEEVATLMANDLLNTHPELLEAMHKEIPAPDPKHGETTPSMQFHLFNTDEPVTDSQYGPIRQFNPIFALGKDGKVGLKTVFGGQRPAASDRHTIRVTPTTSPAPGHMNSHIHEDLPSRFDFRETKQPENLPSQVETPVEKKPQPHPRHAEMSSIYNLPDSFRLPALQNRNIDATDFNQWMTDNKLASEPMDLAFRLLKTRIASPDEAHPQIGRTVYDPETNEIIDSSIRLMPTKDGRPNNPENFIRDIIHEDMHVATLPEVGQGGNVAHGEFPAFLGEEIYSQRLAEEGKSERRREPYDLERTTPFNQALYRVSTHPNVPAEERGQAKQAWYDDIQTGEPMDIAWRFFKMPMVDTDVPGLRMAYGDDTDEPVIGMQPSFSDESKVMQMTPNEYFDIIQDHAEKQGGIDRVHFTAPPIPGREADFRWDNMKYTNLLSSGDAEKYRHIRGASQKNIARIIDGIKSGMPIGMPYLGYTVDGEHDGFQDGGHRMESLRQMGHGDTPVPVFRFQDEE